MLQVDAEQILDVIEDNIEDLIVPLAHLINEAGWEDVVFQQFGKTKSFITEIAEILIEQDKGRAMVLELEMLMEDEND